MNKKVKLSVKIATVTSSVLFGFAMCATAIANENVTAINNFLKVSNFNYYEPADAHHHGSRAGYRVFQE